MNIERVRESHVKLFDKLFKYYFNSLSTVAFGILREHDLAKEAVQEVFLKLWESGMENLDRDRAYGYLIRATRNKSIDYIRKEKVKNKHEPYHFNYFYQEYVRTSYGHSDEEVNIKKAVDTLPPKCKQVLIYSRFENLSHKEISLRMGISAKTVEGHITKAMKNLKNMIVRHEYR